MYSIFQEIERSARRAAKKPLRHLRLVAVALVALFLLAYVDFQLQVTFAVLLDWLVHSPKWSSWGNFGRRQLLTRAATFGRQGD